MKTISGRATVDGSSTIPPPERRIQVLSNDGDVTVGAVERNRTRGDPPVGILDRLVTAARTAFYLLLAVPLGRRSRRPTHAPPRLHVAVASGGARTQARERRAARANPTAAERARSEDAASSCPSRCAAAGSLAATAVALASIALTVGLALRAAEGLGGGSERYLGPWALGPAVGAVLAALAIASAIVSVAVLDGLARPLRALERRLLNPSSAQSGGVREALVERIGDDVALDRVLAPRTPGVRRRAWAPGRPARRRLRPHVDRRRARRRAGRRNRPRRRPGHAARTSFGLRRPGGPRLEDQRVQVALRARVEELRASRARIVEAGMEARRQARARPPRRARSSTSSRSPSSCRCSGPASPTTRGALSILDASVEKLNARSPSCGSSPTGSIRRSSRTAGSAARSRAASTARRSRWSGRTSWPSASHPPRRRPAYFVVLEATHERAQVRRGYAGVGAGAARAGRDARRGRGRRERAVQIPASAPGCESSRTGSRRSTAR